MVKIPRNHEEALRDFYREYGKQEEPPNPNGQGPTTEHTDEEIIEKLLNQRGGKFARLWKGDISDYEGDESRADDGFIFKVYSYTQDEEQIRRIHGQSGLAREKSLDREDYLQRSIDRARDKVVWFYEWPSNTPPDDTDDNLQKVDVKPFPLEVLPEAIRTYIEEAARSIGCPVEFIALPVLASCAAAVGNARVLKIKRRWKEPPIFWLLLIGEPATKKTPGIREGTFPILDVEMGYKDRYQAKMEDYRERVRQHKKDVRDAREAKGVEPAEPPKPTQQRILVSDATVEALARVLADNWRGVLMSKDELAGWVRGMDQYKQGGRGSDRQFWISTWSASSTPVDRRHADEVMYVTEPCINIVGGIQPEILPELGKERNDGFFDRILPAYPDTSPQKWTEDDVSEEAEQAYKDLIDNLRSSVKPEIDDNDKERPQTLGFSTDARRLWGALTDELKEDPLKPGFPKRLRGPWGKLEAYLARFGLLFATIRLADNPTNLQVVNVEDLEAAHKVVQYFQSHARRVYKQLYADDPEDTLSYALHTYLHKNGGQWSGLMQQLYDALPKSSKPARVNEFGRLIRKVVQANPRYFAMTEDRHTEDGQFVSLQIVVSVVSEEENPHRTEEEKPDEDTWMEF